MSGYNQYQVFLRLKLLSTKFKYYYIHPFYNTILNINDICKLLKYIKKNSENIENDDYIITIYMKGDEVSESDDERKMCDVNPKEAQLVVEYAYKGHTCKKIKIPCTYSTIFKVKDYLRNITITSSCNSTNNVFGCDVLVKEINSYL